MLSCGNSAFNRKCPHEGGNNSSAAASAKQRAGRHERKQHRSAIYLDLRKDAVEEKYVSFAALTFAAMSSAGNSSPWIGVKASDDAIPDMVVRF